MNISITRTIRKMMGWCPNVSMINKEEEMLMEIYNGEYIHRIKGIGFNGVIGILHLMYAVWLISTALWVLAGIRLFPWYVMDITFISSGILLAIGITSLMIFFNFTKSANIHRVLAVVNIALIAVFFMYLSQTLISSEPKFTLITLFAKPFYYYSFGIVSLTLFTMILGFPNIITLLRKPAEERKTKFFTVLIVALMVAFALLGSYYHYLNMQKESLILEDDEDGGYRIYQTDPNTYTMSGLSTEDYPYFLDSYEGTTGHPISEDSFKAIQFLRTKEKSNVMGWWDYQLQIRAADKEPVITYASSGIKNTVGRPSQLYDKFESNEKVVDVSNFFTTESEETAVSIAEKNGAEYVYILLQRWDVYYEIMLLTVQPDVYKKIYSSETLFNEFYKQSMAYRFKSGAELEYFDKIFENEDVIIYQLK
jgi:hypothetical protein